MISHQSRWNVLPAVDGSDHALAATQLLCDLTVPTNTSLHVVSVLIPRHASDHALLEAALERTQGILQDKGLEVTTDLLTGYPAETLIEVSEKRKPDLIVLGAKGLRGTLTLDVL